MKSTSFVAAALVFGGTTTYAIPAPVPNTLQAKAEDLSPNAQVCTAVGPAQCFTIPISSDACIDFTGGLSFLNKEVSAAIIPGGFVCTFYEQFGCLSDQGGADVAILQGGTWTNFGSVPGTAGAVDFNDLASSFDCSPV